MKFRTKPVVIEAFQFTLARRTDTSEWPEWLHVAWLKQRSTPGSLFPSQARLPSGTVAIGTIEGILEVTWDDWIIKGVRGELYPCKPDIFTETYEPVAEE